MDGSLIAFVVSAAAAAFIVGCSYVQFLRNLGFLERGRDFDPWIKWAWFVVWFGFIMGLALILV
jgi:hypothetical protein